MRALAQPLRTYDPTVGFNPFRGTRRTGADVVIVAFFIAIVVALVLWGFLG